MSFCSGYSGLEFSLEVATQHHSWTDSYHLWRATSVIMILLHTFEDVHQKTNGILFALIKLV